MAPHTPVLVGVGAVQHLPESGPVPAPLDLLDAAARAAATDAGDEALLTRLGWVGVPKGTWAHPDPGRALAATWGAESAHTVFAEVGVLQSTVVASAVQAVADGRGPTLVVGGEAAHGGDGGAAVAVAEALAAGGEPDEHLINTDFGVVDQEILRGLIEAPVVYAAIENAWRADRGWSADEHRRRLGVLGHAFAEIAAANPVGWIDQAPEADQIVNAGPANRMIADPYTKLCCSNLRVNQAAALLLMSVEDARAAGLDEDGWVFPWAGADNNLSVPVVQRADLHRGRGFAHTTQALREHTDVDVRSVDRLDLYSCFPVAVQIAAAELGVSDRDDLTVTGGMTFAGGPLNNYVLQATAALALALREDPAATGLTTAVSGFLTKQGAALWGSAPPPRPWAHFDVTDAVRPEEVVRPLVDSYAGDAVAVTGTTVHGRDGERHVVVIGENPDGERFVAGSDDPGVVDQLSGDTGPVGLALTVDDAELVEAHD